MPKEVPHRHQIRTPSHQPGGKGMPEVSELEAGDLGLGAGATERRIEAPGSLSLAYGKDPLSRRPARAASSSSSSAGDWTSVAAVPDSAGATYCDVAADPLGINVYYVWDQGGEIWWGLGSTSPDNEPPTAEFVFSPSTGIYPVEVTFDASTSQDPDGDIVSYSWDFGDSGRAGGVFVKHTYERWGTFVVRLVLRDNEGATGVKTHNIEILRLFQPLNIRWETKIDESLLQSRRVALVTWSKNPANDALGVQIVFYRVYRKKLGESDTAYLFCGEVTAGVYQFLDTDIGKDDVYLYTVTALDSQGHESPILDKQGSSVVREKRRGFPATIKRGATADRH